MVDQKNVHHLRPLDGGGEPPDMEERLRKLEQSVSVIESNYATKSDIAELKAELHSSLRQQTMWSVGTLIAAVGLVFAVMRFTGGA